MDKTFKFQFYPHDFKISGYYCIGRFHDIGDNTLYVDECLQSAPVWSSGCRR